tara:strand:+ start:153 stop:287 length:135 start_codon:yes stop_codon:yes gene_type:complete
MEYINAVHKRRVQAESKSFKDTEDQEKRVAIQAQDILMIGIISI